MPSAAHSPVLVIGGMHRSGTSLVASLCHGAGLYLGHRLMGAAHGNAAGHFEDLDFVELHERILVANGLGSEGFTTDARPEVPDGLADQAAALVAARRGVAAPWGWKDPRTVLLLDFWAKAIPEARFLLVFRPPWEVADSLFRRGDPTFFHNPPLALAVWEHYNTLLLEFSVRHPERCVVRELSQVVADPAAVFSALREHGVPLEAPAGDPFRADLLGRDPDPARARLVRRVAPAACGLYADLRRRAGGVDPPPAVVTPDPARLALAEWARGAAATRQVGHATRRAAAAEDHLATARRELDEARCQRDRLAAEAAALAARLVECTARLERETADNAALRTRLASWQATATDIQEALAALDRCRGGSDLAGRFARSWPDAA